MMLCAFIIIDLQYKRGLGVELISDEKYALYSLLFYIRFTWGAGKAPAVLMTTLFLHGEHVSQEK